MNLNCLLNYCSSQITAWGETHEEIGIFVTQHTYKGWESNCPESFLNFSSSTHAVWNYQQYDIHLENFHGQN